MFGISDLSPAAGVAGIGLQIYGAFGQFGAAKKENQIQQQEIATEQQMNNVRRQSMELGAYRMSLESVRKTQQLAAQSKAAAVNQGAQFGSGAAGGQAQVQAQGAWNILGINQNLELGRSMFNLSDQLSQQKIAMAQAQSQMLTANAWSSFGKMLSGQSGSIGDVSQQAASAAGGAADDVMNFFQNAGFPV